MNLFSNFFFCFVLLLFSGLTQAKIISKVEVAGNEKTQKKSIIKWAGITLGKEITDEEYDEIIEKLKRAYQFNLKKVELVKKTLQIEIEDKWSLFPVPMLTQSGDYYSRGLLVYDNNFLGRMGTFAPGVFWTNSGINGILYWQEDNVITQDVGMKVILLHKADLTQFMRKDLVVDEFETRFDTVILTPNYHVGRHDHKLGPIYMKREILKGSNQRVFLSESFGLYYRHHYNNFKKLPILFDGYQTSFDLFLLKDRSRSVETLHGGDVSYIKPHGRHFFKSQLHYYYTSSDDYLSPKMLGGNNGHRGYDRESLPAKSNVGLMLEEQINVWKNIYASTFYEYNISRLIRPVANGAELKESTLGLSVSYYFNKISIPGVIIEYARNIEDRSTHIHINVGLKL